MDEIKNENVGENVEEVATAQETEAPEAETATEENAEVATTDAENAETTVDQAQDEADDPQSDAKPKKKIKLPKGLQTLVDKIKANENLRQMIVFTLFSFICGGSQMIITYLLSLMRLAGGTLAAPFVGIPLTSFAIFGYDTTAEFIGFLVGSIVGQVLTFVLNRKKTFNCTNNIVISGIMYVILAVFIIFMQTLLGGAITSACWNAKPDADGFLALLFNLAGQAVAGISALIISFLGNKFLVMRNWGEKKAKATEEEK